MKHLLDGLKMLDGNFWRAFCKKPAMGFCMLCLVIFFFSPMRFGLSSPRRT